MEHHDHDDRDHEHGQSSRPRQPDKYYGQRDFLLLGNWLFSVDQYFVLTDMPERKQASYVSTLLRAEALLSALPTRISMDLYHGRHSVPT